MTNIPLGPFMSDPGFDRAAALDAADPLSSFRGRYHFGDPDLIYLDGNSLSRLPNAARPIVDQVLTDQWGDRLIRSWNDGWWDLQLQIGDRLAPLLGASSGEVIISDSTSVNLYKLALSAMKARPDRKKIVTDDTNFPTDVYVLRGVAESCGSSLEVVGSEGTTGTVASLQGAIDHTTALVSLSHTAFKSGYTHDLAAMTEMAHRSGAMVLWDLSHSAGVVPIDLDAAGADLAVGCTYKYLNGGPGSPAFLYVRRELQSTLHNPISAWWGHANPFAFDLEFAPAKGIRKFHTGTMPILSLAVIEAGINDVAEAGIGPLRAKSISLTEFFIEQWEEHLASIGFRLGSPRDASFRGSHVALSHHEAWRIDRALIELAKVIPDFRAPDTLRFGLAPLYTSHQDVHTAIQRLKAIVESGVYAEFDDVTLTVT